MTARTRKKCQQSEHVFRSLVFYHLSVSACAIDQFSRLYFTVQLAKLKSLFEFKSCLLSTWAINPSRKKLAHDL